MIHAHRHADTTLLAMFFALGVAVFALTLSCAVSWVRDCRLARKNETQMLDLWGVEYDLPRTKRESNKAYRARLRDFIVNGRRRIDTLASMYTVKR